VRCFLRVVSTGESCNGYLSDSMSKEVFHHPQAMLLPTVTDAFEELHCGITQRYGPPLLRLRVVCLDDPYTILQADACLG
jgi:hypothetical protein